MLHLTSFSLALGILTLQGSLSDELVLATFQGKAAHLAKRGRSAVQQVEGRDGIFPALANPPSDFAVRFKEFSAAVDLLVTLGADPNRRFDKQTPLHAMAMIGTLSDSKRRRQQQQNTYVIAKAILAAKGCDPNLIDVDDFHVRNTPLTLYLRYLNDPSGMFLKAMAESPKVDIERRGGPLQSFPLHMAAWRGRLDLVKLLVEHGAKVNSRKENGQNVLHAAAMSNNKANADVIRYLLRKGASPTAKSKGYWGFHMITKEGAPAETPIEMARRKGFKLIIEALEGR